MQLATAGNLEGFGRIGFLHAEGNVGIQLTEQSLAKVTGGDKFAFLTCERAVVYDKVHGDRRLGNLLERNGYRILG